MIKGVLVRLYDMDNDITNHHRVTTDHKTRILARVARDINEKSKRPVDVEIGRLWYNSGSGDVAYGFQACWKDNDGNTSSMANFED